MAGAALAEEDGARDCERILPARQIWKELEFDSRILLKGQKFAGWEGMVYPRFLIALNRRLPTRPVLKETGKHRLGSSIGLSIGIGEAFYYPQITQISPIETVNRLTNCISSVCCYF